MSWQLPGIDLTEGDLMALMVGDRALEGYRNSAYYDAYKTPGYDEAAIRVIDPLQLMGQRGEWYLLCWSHRYEEVRIYALFRTKQARIRQERLSRPEGFSVEE